MLSLKIKHIRIFIAGYERMCVCVLRQARPRMKNLDDHKVFGVVSWKP